jgi:hypothetical protein
VGLEAEHRELEPRQVDLDTCLERQRALGPEVGVLALIAGAGLLAAGEVVHVGRAEALVDVDEPAHAIAQLERRAAAADGGAEAAVDGGRPGGEVTGGAGGHEGAAGPGAQLEALVELQVAGGPQAGGQVAAAVEVLAAAQRAGDVDVGVDVPGLAGDRVVVGVEAVADREAQLAARAPLLRAQRQTGARGVHVVAADDAVGRLGSAVEAAPLVLVLIVDREAQGLGEGRPILQVERGVHEGPVLLVVGQTLALRRGRGRAAVGAWGVELAVVVVREGEAHAVAGLPDQARVGGQLLEAGAALGDAVGGEEGDLDRAPGGRRVDRSAGAQQADVAVADAAEEAELVLVREVELGAAAELAVGGARAEHAARTSLPAARAELHRGVDRRGQEGAAHRVGAVAGRGAAAQDLELLHGAGVDGEEVLVGTLAEGAVVEADAVEHQDRLLAGEAADVGRALAVRGLLHVHAGLEAQRVGGRAGQPLLEVAAGHHARGAVVVDRLDPRLVADRRASGLPRTCGGGPGRTQWRRVGGAGLEDRSEPHREGEADQTARTGRHRSRIVAAVGSRGKPPVRRR